MARPIQISALGVSIEALSRYSSCCMSSGDVARKKRKKKVKLINSTEGNSQTDRSIGLYEGPGALSQSSMT